MSKALELAEQCGMALSRGGNGYWDNKAQIEAFYHAARAEALREAADRVCGLCQPEIMRMADREGK